MSPEAESRGGEFEVLTSPGPAAIAVIRAQGPHTGAFVARHLRTRRPPAPECWYPGRILRAELLDREGAAVDDILLSVHALFPTWDLRLHLHGNPWLVRRCTEWLQACGLTRVGREDGSTPTRVHVADEAPTTLWPTEDALEAEACTLLPKMLTLRGATWLLQQVNRLRESIDALLATASANISRETCLQIAARVELVDWFTRPLRVVLAGPSNAGKSTLANALADRPVSIVSPTPGTTRDWIEVPGEAEGFPVVWLDTAGLRESRDALEAAGAARTRQLLCEADEIVIVLDATPAADAPRAEFLATFSDLRPACVVLNKSDLIESAAGLAVSLPREWQARTVTVSATEQMGLDALRRALLRGAGRSDAGLDSPAAFTPRQVRILNEAADATNCNAMRTELLRLLEPERTR